MPNDAVLDLTVHHQFAEDQFNRGKSSNHGHDAVSEAHDLSPPRCPPFLKAGAQDLLWLYKSQRKASVKRGTSGRSRRKRRRNRTGRKEKKTEETNEQ
jgi:hypothetical protein